MDPEAPPIKLPRAVMYLVWLIITILTFWLLVVGKGFLIPLVFAALLLYISGILTRQWLRLKIGGKSMPVLLARGLSVVLILSVVYGIATVITDNASGVAQAAPRYQDRLLQVYDSTLTRFDVKGPEAFQKILDRVDFGSTLRVIASEMGGLLGNGALILVYLFFLLLERSFAPAKMRALFPDEQSRARVTGILDQIDHDVRIYLGVKTSVSLLTATASYLIMRYVGLDFPEFFALLIFIFNFIPNIGSLVATTLPTLLALVQFDGFREFLIVGIGVTAIQMLVGNFIEPPLMGKSLNISPLVVILALVFWGLVWGVPGMFLCVPITVIMMIIFSQFPMTHWIAVLLSKDGTVRGS